MQAKESSHENPVGNTMKPKPSSYRNVPSHTELYRKGLVSEPPITPDEFNHRYFVRPAFKPVQLDPDFPHELDFNHER